MLAGFLILILCQWTGELLVAAMGLPIPGPVLGMLLLFVALIVRRTLGQPDIPPPLEQVSGGLIRYLSLFFLPAGIGIFFLPDTFDGQWLPLALVIVPGTLLTLLVTALLLQALLGKTGGVGQGGPGS